MHLPKRKEGCRANIKKNPENVKLMVRNLAWRKDGHSVKIKKNPKNVKFMVRCFGNLVQPKCRIQGSPYCQSILK